MASYNLVIIGLGNGLVPNGTKPLPKPMLSYLLYLYESYFTGNAQDINE